MSTLSLKNINKIYPNKVQAVFDFNIDIKDKEFVVFVGPSGCGKSTTLRMIAGLESISSGELYIDNEYMNTAEPKDRNIAMVFQSYALYPHMTVYENIKFALKLRKTYFPIYVSKDVDSSLLEKKKEILSEIKKSNKEAKRNKCSDDYVEKRKELYASLNKVNDEIKNSLVQKTGIDEYNIYLCDRKLNKLNQKLLEEMDDESRNQLQKTIEELEKRIDFLKNNEVPLTKLRKPTKEEMDIDINKVAEQIDLIPYLFRKPAALSGGQRQRVALGRAMVRKPKVFLMDEPLSNLDAKLRIQTRNEIRKLHEKVGATTIYVTHDQIEAMTMADRIVIMKDGHIQQIGSPHEVFNNPANKFVGSFIGTSPMNFINAKYENNQFVFTTDDGQMMSLPATKVIQNKLKGCEGREVTIGIRPSNVFLTSDKEKSNPSSPLVCKCDNIELIGDELIIHTNLNGISLVAKAKLEGEINSKEQIEICFDTEHLFIFDKESEIRLA